MLYKFKNKLSRQLFKKPNQFLKFFFKGLLASALSTKHHPESTATKYLTTSFSTNPTATNVRKKQCIPTANGYQS